MEIVVSVTAVLLGVGLLCVVGFAQYKRNARKNARIDELETKEKYQAKVLEAYRCLGDCFNDAGWKVNQVVDLVGVTMQIHVTRKLVSGGRLYMRFSVGNPNYIMFSPELPPSKIPEAYRKKRAEDLVEKEFLKVPVFRKTYTPAENWATSWSDVAKLVIEAVDTYEREWTALKDHIGHSNRLILRAVKEHEAVDVRLLRDLDKIVSNLRPLEPVQADKVGADDKTGLDLNPDDLDKLS